MTHPDRVSMLIDKHLLLLKSLKETSQEEFAIMDEIFAGDPISKEESIKNCKYRLLFLKSLVRVNLN